MTVTLRLPSVLKVAVGADRVQVAGRTVGEALEDACQQLPNLRQHILVPGGELRPHVLCVLNDEVLARDRFAAHAVEDGDEIRIHQAITGG